MNQRIVKIRVVLMGAAIVLLFGFLIGVPKVSALYTTAQINAKLPNGTGTAVGLDSGCRNNLLDNIKLSGGAYLRDSINGATPYGSASYRPISWLSARGTPNTNNPVSVPWGTTSIPLQINSLQFICGTLVSPESYPSPWSTNPLPKNPYSQYLYNQTGRWVLSAANANDRVPNAIGTSNMRPAIVDTYTQVVGFTVPGGTLSGVGSTLYIKRDNNSRYWFASPVNVTLNYPGGVTQVTTLKINMSYKTITGYHSLGTSFPPRAEGCKGQPGDYRNLNFSQCGIDTYPLTITFSPVPRLTATTVVNKTKMSLGDTANFTHTITKIGTQSITYKWRICYGLYTTAVTNPNAACTGYTTASSGVSLTRPYLANNAANVGKYYCERIMYAIPSASVDSGGSSGKCVLIQAATISCQGMTVDPVHIDPFTKFSITVSASNSSGAPLAADTMSIKITPISSSGATWSYAAGPVGVTDTTNPVSVTFPGIGPTGQTGQWIVEWTYAGTGGSQVCGGLADTDARLNVANQPYLKVYGGDVSAGTTAMSSGGAQVCSDANNDAGVYSWNNRAPGGYSGAGAQYAVMALSQVLDFASSASTAGKPSGLAFANTGLDAGTQYDPANGLFGGYFGGTTVECNFTGDDNPTQLSGSQTLSNTSGLIGGPIGVGTSKVIYVTGDVYINGNITYSGYAGSWNSPSDIPYFKLVVLGGNIYINPSVTQLDGVYVAEQDDSGAGGTIYTCATGLGLPADPLAFTTFGSTCRTKLTVNGAFAAQQIQFLRTIGTVGNSGADTRLSNNAAEVFNYSPEVWLPRNSGISIGSKYDAITGLPPVL